MNAVLTALQSGYSPDKILKYLTKIDPDLALKINTAMQAGHSVEKILNYVSQMGGKVSKLFENEKQPESNIYKRAQKSIHPFLKSAGQLGLMAGAGALGTAALSRAIPQAAQQLIPEVSTALSQPPAIPSQFPQAAQEALTRTAPQIGKELISKELEQSGSNLPVSAIEKASETISKGSQPLPPLLLEKAQNLLKHGNSPEQTLGALQSLFPKQVKEYEKETGQSIIGAIQSIDQGNNLSKPTAAIERMVGDVRNPELRETQLNAPENLSEIGGIAKGITDNFYEGIFNSLKEGKDTFSGVKDPLIAKAKPLFEKGLIRSPEELREFANNPEIFKKNNKIEKGEIRGNEVFQFKGIKDFLIDGRVKKDELVIDNMFFLKKPPGNIGEKYETYTESTQLPEELKGKGYATRSLENFLEEAKKEGYKKFIIPVASLQGYDLWKRLEKKGLVKINAGFEGFTAELNEKKIVALPDGTIGTLKNIRKGIAEVDADGTIRRRKADELIESPLPEKELHELYDDLVKGIEAKTGQELSKMANLVGFDPKNRSLIYQPSRSKSGIYVYEDLTDEEINELKTIEQLRRTSGENYLGAWKQGTKSVIGSKLYDFISKLQAARGGKGKEYSYKFDSFYDALAPAKEASEKEHKRRKDEREKEEAKRKAKKPGSY